ncbi:hypothetical protein KM043_012150 [Ampulex compressa]|nr:hypothetical protein KM043_012150 [Ampulex compressa]
MSLGFPFLPRAPPFPGTELSFEFEHFLARPRRNCINFAGSTLKTRWPYSLWKANPATITSNVTYSNMHVQNHSSRIPKPVGDGSRNAAEALGGRIQKSSWLALKANFGFHWQRGLTSKDRYRGKRWEGYPAGY